MKRGMAGGEDSGRRDFHAMFEEHYDAVYRYARRRVGPDHADDVASEAFAVAWRRAERVPPGRELPWLYACARRITLAHLRADRRQGVIAESLGRRQGDSVHADDADRVIERSGALEALSRLTELERELVMLVTWEGLDCRQAAAVIGCAHVTARARLHRARKRLTAHLAPGTVPTEPERTRPPKEATWTT